MKNDVSKNNRVNHLRSSRVKLGYSQQEVAKILGITVSAISQYETGKRMPKREILFQIAKIYDTTIDYLMGITNNPVSIDSYDLTHTKYTSFAQEQSHEDDTYNTEKDNLDAEMNELFAVIHTLPKEKQITTIQAIKFLLQSNN